MSGVIPEQIRHLDFDVAEDQAEPCSGMRVTDQGRRVVERDPGHAAAQVRVQYRCCGMIVHFCLACYNDMVVTPSGQRKGQATWHVFNGRPQHQVTFPVFAHTWWIGR